MTEVLQALGGSMARLDEQRLADYRDAYDAVVAGLRSVDAGPPGSLLGFMAYDAQQLESALATFLDTGDALMDQVAADERQPQSAFQFLALVRNNLTLLHDTATVAVGDGTRIALPAEINQSDLTALVEYDGGLDDLDFEAISSARRSAVEVIASVFRSEGAPVSFDDAFVDPGEIPPAVPARSLSAMAAPGTADDLVEHITSECSDAVRSAIAGALAAGVLDADRIGGLVTRFADKTIAPGGGPWWRRFISHIVRATTKWFKQLIEALGISLSDVAEKFVGWILKASKAIDSAVTYALARPDIDATIGKRPGDPAELAVTRATFGRGMTLLEHSGTIITAVAGAFLAGPAAGPVAAVVVSLIALWLASDHLGFDVGLFRGRPDFHQTDVAGSLE